MSEISKPVSLSYNLDAVLWFMDIVLRKKKYNNQEDYIKDCREILDIAERNWLFEWEEQILKLALSFYGDQPFDVFIWCKTKIFFSL
jgi:hypothetical protein